MKVLFAGTPEIAVPTLEAVAARHTVVGVLTNPDRISGRGRKSTPPPVKQKALELHVPVFQFDSLKSEAREVIGPLGADVMVVFAYGRIFGPRFLSLFPLGGINVHPSLLPKYRGSVPLIAPLLNGDQETGVTIQKIALRLDSGDILLQHSFPLTMSETAADLSEKASVLGAEMVGKVLDKIEEGKVQSISQDDSLATYCRRLEKRDGLVHWRLPVIMIERMVRAYTPWPKAFTFWKENQLTILEAGVYAKAMEGSVESGDVQEKELVTGPPGTVVGVDRKNGILVQTGKGLLCIRRMQLQGKKPLSWKEFLNGNRDLIGSQLGEM